MSNLIAIVYDDMVSADQAGHKLQEKERERNIRFDDIVTVVNKPAGIIFNHTVDLVTRGAATGSLLGAITGGVLGMFAARPIFGIFLGASAGAGIGAAAGAKSNYGIKDHFMKKVTLAQGPGKSVLFVQADDDLIEDVIDGLEGTGGEIIESSFSINIQNRLEESMLSEENIKEEEEESVHTS